jgi:hypothetical protein
LIATAIARPGAGGITLILDNESGKPQQLLLRGAANVRVSLLRASSMGLEGATLTGSHSRVRLSVPANAVIAVSTLA